MAEPARHEIRVLLRAHLAAAVSSYGHRISHCPICHHLLRLATDSAPGPPEEVAAYEELAGSVGHGEPSGASAEPLAGDRRAVRTAGHAAGDESPSPA
jgi:hypothetical protein